MLEGDVVDARFVIDRLAGRGGMGAVYQARDRASGDRVAIKVLHETSSGTVERFIREAQVLSGLDHPNIVRHLGHGLLPSGEPYIAMEWLEGEDLLQRLQKGVVTLEQSLSVIEHVADALAVAHARGIVHRDIKPGNIMLIDGDARRVKLLDFGIARRAHDSVELTGTGFALGTPGYMSPEQARSSRRIDARADVYSLGCVLFRCVTGRTPFVGRDAMAVLAKIALEEAPRARQLRPEVPLAVDELVARMLAHEPDRRFPDGAAVATSIRSLGPIAPGARGANLALRALTGGEKRLVAVVLAPSAARGGRWQREPSESSATSAVMAAQDSMYGVTRPTAIQPTGDGATIRQPQLEEAAREGYDRVIAGRLRQAADAHGARAVFLADGSAAALVTSSGSATDLAVRAARCALAFARVLDGAPVALSTGRAEMTGQLPVGEAIDRAVTLIQQHRERAPQNPGEDAFGVWIDDVTAGLLSDRFGVRREGNGLVLAAEVMNPDASRTLLGRTTPFVGREREVLTLEAIYTETVEEPVSRVVLVTAPAGEGKSRLRFELLRALRERDDAPLALIARGDPLGAGSPFSLLGQALARVVSLDPSRPIEERREQIIARVARRVGPEDVARVSEFIGELVGVPWGDAASVQLTAARQDPTLMGDQIRRASEDFIAAETHEQPVLLVLEDLQWGDLPTVRFVDGLLRNLRDRPLMVLALARPEVQTALPGLFASHAVTALQLAPLTRKASERLARAVLGETATDALVERVVVHSGGNAFYLEELLRAVADGHGDALPETVIAMMQSRIEALEADARRVLRAASVFGPLFSREGLAHLLGAETAATLDEWLAELVRREWITRRPGSRVAGDVEFGFRQGTVRESAYATLTENDLVLGHRLAGEWLEQAGDRDVLALAEHFRRGHEPARAVRYLVDAVRIALEGNDLAGVLHHAGVAAENGASGEALGEVRLCEAEAHRWRGENALAEMRGRDALALLRPGSVGWYRAVGEIAMACGRMADLDGLNAMGETWFTATADDAADGARRVAGARAAVQLLHAGRLDLARRLLAAVEAGIVAVREAQPLASAWVDTARLGEALGAGNSWAAGAIARRVVTACERAGDLRMASMQRVNVGYVCIEIGALDEAEVMLRAAVASSERMGLRDAAAIAESNLGLALTLLGRHAEARVVLRRAIDALSLQGNRLMEGSSRNYLAIALLGAGDLAEAAAEARRSIDVLAASPGSRAHALSTLARTLVASGQAVEALIAAQEAARSVGEAGAAEEGEAAIRLAVAEAMRATGDEKGAREVADRARARLLERASQLDDAAVRDQFLRNVPDHARTMAF